MKKHKQGTHCTKVGADSSTENTSNATEFICPIPKVLDFNEKNASLDVRSPRIKLIKILESCLGPKIQDFCPKINCNQMKPLYFENSSTDWSSKSVKI